MTPAYVYRICSACRVSSDCGPGDEATCGLFWRSRGSAGLVPPRDDPEHRWFRLRAEPCSVSSCHEARQLDGCSSARIAPWRMATSCAIELAEFAGRREACTASSDRLHTHTHAHYAHMRGQRWEEWRRGAGRSTVRQTWTPRKTMHTQGSLTVLSLALQQASVLIINAESCHGLLLRGGSG